MTKLEELSAEGWLDTGMQYCRYDIMSMGERRLLYDPENDRVVVHYRFLVEESKHASQSQHSKGSVGMLKSEKLDGESPSADRHSQYELKEGDSP